MRGKDLFQTSVGRKIFLILRSLLVRPNFGEKEAFLRLVVANAQLFFRVM